MMQQLRFRFLHLALLLLSIGFYLKVRRAANIQAFLAEQSSAFGSQEQQAEYRAQFMEAFSRMKDNAPPAILLLNKFALNISLNFLCNLRKFPGAIERVVAVVFDSHSNQILKNTFADIGGVVHWKLPALEEHFSAGDGRYQLFQYFRAKLAALLTETTSEFWMVQADTIWRENLFQLIGAPDATKFADAELIFDSEGSEGLLRSMIAGGYFLVRSSNKTKHFFESTAQFLLEHFATDNNVMNRHCIKRVHDVQCAQINYSIISNWRAAFSPSTTQQNGEPFEPPLFQFDGSGDGSNSKFEKMMAEGHLFVDPESIPAEVGDASKLAAKCLPPTNLYRNSENKREEGRRRTRAENGNNNRLMATVQAALEMVHARFPGIKHFLLAEIFPYYAAYFFM